MSQSIIAEPLNRAAFEPFGEVIDKAGPRHFPINNGKCIRHHDLARVELAGPEPRALINIFSSEAYTPPLELKLVERHPLGSQAFMPLHQNPFLVIACEDRGGEPGTPKAFLTAPGQGINFRRNVWHGVLAPLGEAGDFLVVDRGGEGDNLEEYFFDAPYRIELP